MRALLHFRHLFAPEKSRFALALALALVTLAAGIGLLGVSGWFLTAAALTTSAAMFNLFGPSSAIRGLSLVRILARYGEKLIGHDATLRVLADIRAWLFARLFARAARVGEGLRRGDLVARLTADVDALDAAFLVAIGPILAGLAVALGMTVLLAFLLPGAALIYGLAIGSAALLVPALLVMASRAPGREVLQASEAARTALLDAIEGHADLLAFGQADEARRGFAIHAARLARVRRMLAQYAAWASAAIVLLAAIAILGTLVAGVEAYRAGEVSGPVLVGVVLAVIGSFEASAALVRSVAKLGASASAAERLAVMDGVSMAPHYEPVPLPAGGDIGFEDISYGYDPARPVLENITFRVPEGARIAIRGPSGGGKSTLLALLAGLDHPQNGRVLVAGTDIARVAESDLRARIALLEQNAPVFLATLRENLLIGRAQAADDELWQALERARLADFVRTLPAGLDTLLGEAGRTLSAGQARRLCLARALLSGAAIIALDEPTSGLDRDTERAFFRDLPTAVTGRTLLLVTHADLPPGTVDRVLDLRAGRLH